MSESSGEYLEPRPPDPERVRAKAEARAAIEQAIALLQANQEHINQGQDKAIKRILYHLKE